jgi:hypothetical protein
MPHAQPTLIDLPPAEPGDETPRRTTSKGIAPGDIVLVDKRGRRFHAVVTGIDQQDSGRFELEVRPIERGISWRTATVREIADVWRKARRA